MNFTQSEEPKRLGNGESDYNPAANQLFYRGSATGAQDDINRSRQKATEATQRGAYQTNLGGFNESRGYTMGSLANLSAAAEGRTPSVAAMQSQQATEDAIRGGQSMAAGVKGGAGARVAAMRNATQQAGVTAARGAQDAALARAQEMTGARQALAQAAIGAQGQDLSAAGLQQQAELQQRQLNQQNEQFYETQGQRTAEAELQAAMERQRMADERGRNARQQQLQTEDQEWGKTKDVIGMVTGAAGGVVEGIGSIFSDPATKEPLSWGSLGPLNIGSSAPAAAPETFSGDKGMLNGSVKGELQAHSDYATRFQRNPGAMPSDMRMKTVMPSDMRMKTAMPSDMRMKTTMSDPKTKEPARLGASGAVDRDAGDAVAERRKSGGYAAVDTAPSISDADTADANLDAAMSRGTADATPYDREPEQYMGVAGAPRGYAARREGKPGSMFGNSPEIDSSVPGVTQESGAPGSNDWARYGGGGEDAKRTLGAPGSAVAQESGVDWKHGGQSIGTGKTPKAFDALSSIFGGVQSGVQGRPPPARTPSPRIAFKSDERAKDVLPLAEPEGQQLRIGDDDRAFLASEAQERPGASLSGPTPRYSAPSRAEDAPTPKAGAKAKPRDLMAEADAMLAKERKAHEGRMAQGPAVRDAALENAARSLEPSVYKYKDEFLPAEQSPGEVNVGPMANKMAEDPVAGTAVVRDPKSGMLTIDIPKYTKVLGATTAQQQRQNDEQDAKLDAIMGSLAQLNDVPGPRARKARRAESGR